MNRVVVLHVDDDPNDRLLLQHACNKAALDLVLSSVCDGDEAIAYLEGCDKFKDRDEFPLPNLLLLDLKMPRINGFEVIAWVRKQQNLRFLPIVVLSSSSHDADLRRAYEMGVNSYLVKPVSF